MDLRKPLYANIVAGTLASAVLGGAGYGYYVVSSTFERIKANRSPSAVLVPVSPFSPRPNPAINNDDVNGDGSYESVLSFKNPETGGLERFLIERDGQGRLAVRAFQVADGKILYRD